MNLQTVLGNRLMSQAGSWLWFNLELFSWGLLKKTDIGGGWGGGGGGVNIGLILSCLGEIVEEDVGGGGGGI